MRKTDCFGKTRLVLHVPSSSWAGKRNNHYYLLLLWYITAWYITAWYITAWYIMEWVCSNQRSLTADCHTPIRFRQTCSSGSLVSLATGTCLLAASPYSLCLPFWNYGALLFVMFALGNASRVDVKGLAIQAQVYWQLCYPAYEVC